MAKGLRPLLPPVPANAKDMEKLKEQILKSIQSIDPKNKLKNQIEITITPEGLRIDLMESAKGTFFELGNCGTDACTEGAAAGAIARAGQAAQ